MKKPAGLVCAFGGVAARATTAKRVDAGKSFGAWRRALLGVAGALALALAWPQTTRAQGIEDIEAAAAADIIAIAIVQGPVAGSNTNAVAIPIVVAGDADANAVVVVNNVDIVTINPGEHGINAQSLATRGVDIDVSVNQSNVNVNNNINIQVITQRNEATLDIDVDVAALADTVDVDNQANITADGHGINAISNARSLVTIDSTFTQTNSNQLNTNTATPTQVVSQRNEQATSISVLNEALASDVNVLNIGTTTAGLNGVNAASIANAVTQISEIVTQSNTNALNGTRDNEQEQIQVVAQENVKSQEIFVSTIAQAGNVSVQREGNTKAVGDGISATSRANATTTISKSASQTNTNTASGTGVADGSDELELTQVQVLSQLNANEQLVVAGSGATSGDVTVSNVGDTEAGGTGVNANSTASAQTAVALDVIQRNNNTMTAAGAAEEELEADQVQVLGQRNANEQLVIAGSNATSGNVTVSNSGNTKTGGEGVFAQSDATAITAVALAVSQTNDNSMAAEADELEAEQVQVLGQSNENEQFVIAGSAAISGHVNVSIEGDTKADGDGVNAASNANATTAVAMSAEQLNSNNMDAGLDGEGTGEELSQVQVVEQENSNDQLALVAADSRSGPVSVTSQGKTKAGGNGISASSNAGATAALTQSVTQTNQNNAEAIAAPETDEGEGVSAEQIQVLEQTNSSRQAGEAIATAYSDYVYVNQSGQLEADGDGITASSSASATAALSQNATQSNTNSATIILEPISSATAEEGEAEASQEQSVVQLNVNEQDGFVVATADSGPVDVFSFNDPAGGNGINASSTATATAALSQTATQTNSNSATITLPPLEVVDEEPSENDAKEEGADQNEEVVLQLNVNDQDALAVATASSDYVYVDQSGTLKAGADGINAVSEASATAAVSQEATQSNTDTKEVVRARGTPPGEGQTTVQPLTAVEQEELVIQANLNQQEAAAIAGAHSGPVTVLSSDKLQAVGNGITATSAATATAALSQTVKQSNANIMGATGNDIEDDGQQQIVIQANLSEQRAAAIAGASSDYVYVNQDGQLKAGLDGITARSEASSTAALSQSATQSNSNELTAVLEPVPNPPTGGEAEIEAEQEQIVVQLNINEQEAASIATADSGPVDVISFNDPAGGDGINATSAATATAALSQSVTQENTNRASIGLPPLEVVEQAPGDGDEIEEEAEQEEEFVLQLNVNDQDGLAIATANVEREGDSETDSEDHVFVDQSGTLKAGADGITATSEASATAALSQTATQTNTDSKNVVRARGAPLEEGQRVIQPETEVEQEELVIQANLNEQEAAAIAAAHSDPVTVLSSDKLQAVGNGITAISKASAVAALSQSVAQGNTNRMSATGTEIVEDDEEEPGQQQTVIQANLSKQRAAAIAGASSDYVYVDQSGQLKAGLDGITARSEASSIAALSQTATQNNNNSVTATLQPAPYSSQEEEEIAAAQDQFVLQLNVNSQEGLSLAKAESGYVEVRSFQDPSDGNGIIAESTATATAALSQTAGQVNSNSATVTLPPRRVVLYEPGSEPGYASAIPVEEVSQDEEVIQLNLSFQRGAAIALANSDYVDVVQSGSLKAGLDGITARSEATATAALVQTANQANTDTKLVERAPAPEEPNGDDRGRLQPGTSVVQEQQILQANINVQEGLALAISDSGPVTVLSSDKLQAGGNGINAESNATSTAALAQTANQSNINSAEATGTRITQDQGGRGGSLPLLPEIDSGQTELLGQVTETDLPSQQEISQSPLQEGLAQLDLGFLERFGVIQANINLQRGAAIAKAFSDYVEVDQNGSLKTGGDGITARSDANAVAALSQTAIQSNSNSATATLEAPIRVFYEEEELGIQQVDGGFAVAQQSQGLLQLNVNIQEGLAFALAESGYVEVRSFIDPSDGNGIIAESNASATAALSQSVTQTNSNSANVTLPPFAVVTYGESETWLTAPDSVQQFETVVQANVSVQQGAAIALATSDYVEVDQSGSLKAGLDGITARSKADAVAALSQTATQSNTDTKLVERAEAPEEPNGDNQGPLQTGAIVNQGQRFILQANVNLQDGSAVAVADSDYVEVRSFDSLSAGGNGIIAESKATATAALSQNAVQTNTNSLEATGTDIFQNQGGAAGGIALLAEDGLGETALLPEQGLGEVSLDFLRRFGVIQANINVQDGEAIAKAFSDYVEVEQSGTLHAGLDGITARSTASATAALGQTATQSNSNSVTATLEPPLRIKESPCVEACAAQVDGGARAFQSQDVLQLNVNVQEGFALAIAESGYVEVTSVKDPSDGNGIIAESDATATAALSQTATQSNSNSAHVTLPPLLLVEENDNVGIAAPAPVADFVQQAEDVVQINVNLQHGAAIAEATSDYVEVDQSGALSAGIDGITARSKATATALLAQTATQSNSDSKLVERPEPTEPPGEGQELVQPITTVIQQERVQQVNFSAQSGLAVAVATSDEVDVLSLGDLSAGGNGIVAESSATATAALSQEANQSNDNSMTAEGTTIIQDQGAVKGLELERLVLPPIAQANFSEQEGAAIAKAFAASVNVDQSGSLSAGGDGITAQSTAVATAALSQTATQSNKNAQDATTAFTAIQTQDVSQFNSSDQDGFVLALAESGPVDVLSFEDPSGGDGINAASSAEATAALAQTADQSNENRQDATLPIGEFTVTQDQFYTQTNESEQEGFVLSTASSDYVDVAHSGNLVAGGDGINATSEATAVALLSQAATQSNDNAQTFSQDPTIPAVLADPVAIDVLARGQTNVNRQKGAAVAVANSGPVEVWNQGDIDAFEDGINAESKAEAVALVGQSVTQNNTTAQTDTLDFPFGGTLVRNQDAFQTNDNGQELALLDAEEGGRAGQSGFAFAEARSDYVKVWNEGDINASGDGINAESEARAVAVVNQDATQGNTANQNATLTTDGVLTAVQNQNANQANRNQQRGAAIAKAESDYVDVFNKGDIEPEDGIDAESTAVAVAIVDQNATQTNTASQVGNITAGGAASLTQTQNARQSNFNEQEGFALATSKSGNVTVVQKGNVSADQDGINAESTAVAVAAVTQSVEQTNDASQAGTITLEPGATGATLVQNQNVSQNNFSRQSGKAIAVALSNDVKVWSEGNINAGENGINAESTAIAVAAVTQSTTQTNEASQDGTIILASGTQDPKLDQTANRDQSNESQQSGKAIAVAVADEVEVDQFGNVKAGEDGIRAISAAVAVAKVEQTVSQTNTASQNGTVTGPDAAAEPALLPISPDNSAAAIAVADKVDVFLKGNVKAGEDGVVGVSAAFAKAKAFGGTIDLSELSENEALTAESEEEGEALDGLTVPADVDALAVAIADKVYIETHGNIKAGKTGIVAVSIAKAEAEGSNPEAIAKSDDVDVVVNGNVKAGGTGIYAASIAEETENGVTTQGEQGDVTVTVNKGKVQGGFGYYGIVVKGGDQNTINIGKRGKVTSKSKHAILGGEEDETVNNEGLVWGDVDLDGGMNAFNNFASGKFYSGWVIDLNGGLLLNEGLLNPGGPGVVLNDGMNLGSELTGDFVQTSSGKYGVDIDMGAGLSDILNVSGTADVDGKVKPQIVANPFTGTQTVTILTAAGGVTGDATVKDTALVDYSLLFNLNDIMLTMDVDFQPSGLAKEPKGVGKTLNKVFEGGGPDSMEDLALALLQLPTVDDVTNAYNQLTGENFRALSMATLYANEWFAQDLKSCPVRDGGAYSFIAEEQCVWARVRFRDLQYSANAGTTGFDEDAIGISGGAQWMLGGPWYAGLALGYEDSDISTDRIRLSSDGDRFHAGASLKYISGPWLFSGAVTGGWTEYDSTRLISFPGFAATATSDQELTDIAGHFRGAYLASWGTAYVKPMVDLAVINVDMDGFTERGGGGAALTVSGSDETVFTATPALEIGTQRAWNSVLVRPYVRGGVSFYSDADFPLTASFAAAPGVAPFRTTGEIDDVVGDISAGVTFLGVSGGVLTLSYDGRFGDDLEENSVSAKASWKFGTKGR